MTDLDDLFPDTAPYKMGGLPGPSDGMNYSNNALTDLGSGRKIFLVVDDREDEFYAQVYVTTPSVAKPIARIKSPRKRQMIRTAWASVAPLDDYNSIADAVRDVSAKMRENYVQRYKAQLDVQLEKIITVTLQSIGILPPGGT